MKNHTRLRVERYFELAHKSGAQLPRVATRPVWTIINLEKMTSTPRGTFAEVCAQNVSRCLSHRKFIVRIRRSDLLVRLSRNGTELVITGCQDCSATCISHQIANNIAMRERKLVNVNWVYVKMPTLLEMWLTTSLRRVECCVCLVKAHSSVCHMIIKKQANSGVAQQHREVISFDIWFKDGRPTSTQWDLATYILETLVTVQRAGCASLPLRNSPRMAVKGHPLVKPTYESTTDGMQFTFIDHVPFDAPQLSQRAHVFTFIGNVVVMKMFT